ncbi:hypothetical protein ABNQ38_14870 [Azospirillum sp. A29]|jgi:hypothetical protein|uniref:hypothetical protein n=1 Tax=Azospirillum sp. A29 TaxID=3160606 RepID=UPI00366B98D2
MVRARERSFQFRRNDDGVPYGRYHTALNADWNAQIWVPVRRSLYDVGDSSVPSPQTLSISNRAQATIAALLERMGVAAAVVTADARLVDSSSLMVRRLRIGGVLERGLGNSNLGAWEAVVRVASRYTSGFTVMQPCGIIQSPGYCA